MKPDSTLEVSAHLLVQVTHEMPRTLRDNLLRVLARYTACSPLQRQLIGCLERLENQARDGAEVQAIRALVANLHGAIVALPVPNEALTVADLIQLLCANSVADRDAIVSEIVHCWSRQRVRHIPDPVAMAQAVLA